MSTIFTVQPGETWRLDYGTSGGTFVSELCMTPGCSFTTQHAVGQFFWDGFPGGFDPIPNYYTQTCGWTDTGLGPTPFINAGFTGLCSFIGENHAWVNGQFQHVNDYYVAYSILSGFNGTFQVAAQGWASPIATLVVPVPLPDALSLLGAVFIAFGLWRLFRWRNG